MLEFATGIPQKEPEHSLFLLASRMEEGIHLMNTNVQERLDFSIG